MKKIIENLAYWNIIVGLGPFFLAIMSANLFNINLSNFVIFLPWFLVSFFIYSMNRFSDLNEDIINNPERTDFFKKRSNIFLIFSIISLILSILITISLSINLLILIFIPIVLVILYSIRLIPTKIGKIRLKNIFMMKNIVVSFGWSIIPIYISSYFNITSPIIILVSIFIFLRIFIGVTMFDIRDISGDKMEGIKSIPIQLGIENSYKIINILNILSFLIIISTLYFGAPLIQIILISMISLIMGLIYVICRGGKNIVFFCNVIVDGEYILLGLIPLIYLTIF